MAEILGIISGVIALGQALHGLGKGMRFIASIHGAPEAFIDLQNELTTVSAYLNQLREVLHGLSTTSSGAGASSPAVLDYLQCVTDGLNHEVKKLEALELDFRSESQRRTDAKGKPRVLKIKWARHLTTVNELRERVKHKKQDLAHALSLLQTEQIGHQRALIVDITNVVTTGFHQIGSFTQRSEAAILSTLKSELSRSARTVMSTLKENLVRDNTPLGRIDELKEIITELQYAVTQDTEGRATNPEFGSELRTLHARFDGLIRALECRNSKLSRDIVTMQSTLREMYGRMNHDSLSVANLERQLGAVVLPPGSHRPATGGSGQLKRNIHDSRSKNRDTLVSVQTTLNTRRGCKITCNCQCHKTVAVGSPPMLSGILGKLLIGYNSIPSWKTRTCDHPKCRQNSSSRLQLTYLFPLWMLQRGLAISLSWDSLTGVGADIHIAMPRVVASDDSVWLAVHTDDVSWLQSRVAQKKVLPTDIDEDGLSLLMYAIDTHCFEAASFLFSLQPKSSLSWQTYDGITLGALVWQQITTTEDLRTVPVITEIYSLTEDHVSRTRIIDAVLGISDMCLETALDNYHASINMHDSSGYTALHYAIVRDDIEAVRLLLSYKADTSVRTKDRYRASCLHIAALHATASLVRELLAAGSDIEALNSDGRTPLHNAVTSGDKEVVEVLLSAGAGAQSIDIYGLNIYHYAAWNSYGAEEDMLAIIAALTEHGGDPNGLEQHGDAAIHIAIKQGNLAVFRALCRVGTKIEQTGYAGWTVLHCAAMWGQLDMLSALEELEIDAIDPDLVDDRGQTATDVLIGRLNTPVEDLFPMQTTPTDEEVAVFERLVCDMRTRYQANLGVQSGEESDDNWESCEE
ncbi:ankyrin [Coniochaeta sp. PMI_546]|nr:ankyrin [Coniochaeta sp. PMI_546]